MTAARSALRDPARTPAVSTVVAGRSQPRSLITGDVGLSEALRAYRAGHGLSVRTAGGLVGGSHWVWAQWENGVIPGPSYLRQIAELLGLSEADARLLAGPDRIRRAASVGERDSSPLSKARLAAGLSAADLARRLHVSPALVSRWEGGGRTPATPYWPRLAAALGRDVSEVASWFDAEPAPSDSKPLAGLRAIRAARRMSQRDVADALHVDVSTIQRWERLGRAPVCRARELAAALGVDLAVLARPVLAAPTQPPTARPLRTVRERSGFSVRRAATELGVSRSTLLAWERGAVRPSWVHARALSRVYGVPLDRVFAAARLDPPAHLNPRRWTAGQLPAILRELRAWHGLTQREFADLVGVSAATIAGWESAAQQPRRSALRRLDDRLRMTYRLSDLLTNLTCHDR